MKSIYKIAILSTALLISISTFPQKDYEKISEVDGVVFYGKLKPSKFFKKNSPLKLMVKAYNTNVYPVNCSMKVSFFEDGISKEESELINFCVKANKAAKGRKNGMHLLSAGSTNEEMKDDASSFEIYVAKVTKTESCKK